MWTNLKIKQKKEIKTKNINVLILLFSHPN